MRKVTADEDPPAQKRCFVIMPISDPAGYSEGHFSRVYEHLIRPACLAADYEPIRADEVQKTNYIIVDVLRRILDSDLVVCDLSGRNPNVLYELGIRQAFNRPAVLLKDSQTDRIFDIQGLRTLEYDENLRIDNVTEQQKKLTAAMLETADSGDVNSVIQLLGITQATLDASTEISSDTGLVLAAIRELAGRITRLEDDQQKKQEDRQQKELLAISTRPYRARYSLPGGDEVCKGDGILDEPNGSEMGKFQGINAQGVLLKTHMGQDILVPPDDDRFSTLSSARRGPANSGV